MTDMTAETWRVSVDTSVCIGSGGCVLRAPENFALDATRQAHARTELQQASENLFDSAENCPVEAITLTRLDGTLVFPPD